MRRIALIISMLVCGLALSAQVALTDNTHEVMDIIPEANTGLNHIFVVYDVAGVSMTYTAQTENPVNWLEYGELGGGYAEPVEGVIAEGLVTTLPQVKSNRGYIIEEGTTRTYVWVTDYASYRLSLNGLQVDNDGDCATATLHVDGAGDDIVYYSITGVRRVLSRELKLTCNNLEWNDSTWMEIDAVEVETGFKPTIVVPAPLCNTVFTLTGDRFLEFWGEGLRRESNYYQTAAVDARAVAIQEERNNDNETGKTEGTLGGSAPAKIHFEAFCTDAVVHYEWQMAYDPNFEDIQLRLNQTATDQEFNEAGTFYWRFIGSNSDGSCEAFSDVFTVDIGDSELRCPNVFTPGTSEGVNDVWKVSYRSIIDFHCWIFNRWGQQVCEFTDPSQGWDGTYRGKLVGPGVYYYVIRARGSDGRTHNTSGDINIIRYKNRGESGGGAIVPDDPDEPVE